MMHLDEKALEAAWEAWDEAQTDPGHVPLPVAITAYLSALLPEDVAGLVEPLSLSMFLSANDMIARLLSDRKQAASLIQSQAAGWAADKARIAALEADAARYRWLRNQPEGLSNRWPHVTQYPHQPEIDEFKPPQITRERRRKGEYLDEAIDAALSATREQLLSRHARSLLNGERKG